MPIYNSEANPIEFLWALSKRQFRRDWFSVNIKTLKQDKVHWMI